MAVVEPHPVHGYVITDVIKGANGEAKELLSSLKEPETEYTAMPTAGMAVDDRIHLHYLSVNDWDHKCWDYKEPVVSGAGFAYSDDGGRTWVEDNDGDYVNGTPAGRFGSLKLLRIPGEDLLDPTQYEYWEGAGWHSDPSRLADVVPAPVGELSVRWSTQHERWLMMYTNEIDHTIVLRTAERSEGSWDAERVVVADDAYPTRYAPFLLPITGPGVYLTMSMFKPYQVFVMRLTLQAALRGLYFHPLPVIASCPGGFAPWKRELPAGGALASRIRQETSVPATRTSNPSSLALRTSALFSIGPAA